MNSRRDSNLDESLERRRGRMGLGLGLDGDERGKIKKRCEAILKRSKDKNGRETNLGRNRIFFKKDCICRFPDNREACMVVNAWRAGGTMNRDRYKI